MPLLSIEQIAPDVRLGFWRIPDSHETGACKDVNGKMKDIVGQCGSGKRRSEIIAVNMLLRAMSGDDGIVLAHETDGRPVLNGFHVGVSHTRGLAAVILSATRKVAVDVEYRSERVNKIAGKFLRKDEDAISTTKRLLHWCAKETLYKLLPDQRLMFSQMRVNAFDMARRGQFRIEDMLTREEYTIHYECGNSYIVTYTYE